MSAMNHVPTIDMSKSTTGCCALIDPADWDLQEFDFNDKLFVRATTRSFLHMPLNMASVMRATQAKIMEAGAESDEFIILSHESSPWSADHYFAVEHEVPGLETVRLSGRFLSKVFEGPYKDAPKWYEQLAKQVKALGWKLVDTYFFYTECPKCAKEYGKNYVIGFAQVDELISSGAQEA